MNKILIQHLISLADELDKLKFAHLANEVDELIKNASEQEAKHFSVKCIVDGKETDSAELIGNGAWICNEHYLALKDKALEVAMSDENMNTECGECGIHSPSIPDRYKKALKRLKQKLLQDRLGA